MGTITSKILAIAVGFSMNGINLNDKQTMYALVRDASGNFSKCVRFVDSVENFRIALENQVYKETKSRVSCRAEQSVEIDLYHVSCGADLNAYATKTESTCNRIIQSLR